MRFDAGRFGIGRVGRTGRGMMGKLAMGLAVATLGVATVWAQGPGGGGPGLGLGLGPHRPPLEREVGPGGDHGQWWNNPKAVEKFKLTDVQRKAMDDIYQQHRLTIVDLHATLEKAEIAMEPMVRADQPDETKILAQIDRVAQARAELEKANARMLLGIRKQLTPDQWKQLEAVRAARRDGHGDGRDGRGDGHGPWDGHGQGPGGPDRQWHKPGSGGPGQAPPPAGGPGGSGPSAEGPGLPGDGAPGSEQ